MKSPYNAYTHTHHKELGVVRAYVVLDMRGPATCTAIRVEVQEPKTHFMPFSSPFSKLPRNILREVLHSKIFRGVSEWGRTKKTSPPVMARLG